MTELIGKLFTAADGTQVSQRSPPEMIPFQDDFKLYLQKNNLHHPSNVASVAYTFLGCLLSLPYTNVIDRLDIDKIYYKIKGGDALFLTVQFQLGPLEFKPKIKNFILNLNPTKLEVDKYTLKTAGELYHEMSKNIKHLNKDLFADMFSSYYKISLQRSPENLRQNGYANFGNTPYDVIVTKFTLSTFSDVAELMVPSEGYNTLSSSFDKSLEKSIQGLSESASSSAYPILDKTENADSLFSYLLNLYQHDTDVRRLHRSEKSFLFFALGALSLNFEVKYGLEITLDIKYSGNELAFISHQSKEKWITNNMPISCKFVDLTKQEWRKYSTGQRIGSLQSGSYKLPVGLTTQSQKIITAYINRRDFMSTTHVPEEMQNKRSPLPDENDALMAWPKDISKQSFIDILMSISFDMLDHGDNNHIALKTQMLNELKVLKPLFANENNEPFLGNYIFGQLLSQIKYATENGYEEYEKYVSSYKGLNPYGEHNFFVVKRKNEDSGILFSIIENNDLKFGSKETYRKLVMPNLKATGIKKLLCIDINWLKPASVSETSLATIETSVVIIKPFDEPGQHYLTPITNFYFDNIFRLVEGSYTYTNSRQNEVSLSTLMHNILKRYGRKIKSATGFKAFTYGLLMSNEKTFFPFKNEKDIIGIKQDSDNKAVILATSFQKDTKLHSFQVPLEAAMNKMQRQYLKEYKQSFGKKKAILCSVVYHSDSQGDTVHLAKVDTEKSKDIYEACLNKQMRRKRGLSNCELYSEDEKESLIQMNNDEKAEIPDEIKLDKKEIETLISDVKTITSIDDGITLNDNNEKLLFYYKSLKHLQKVGKYSMFLMHGKIAKDIIADFINGDYKDVAINSGLFAWSIGSGKFAEFVSQKGLKFIKEEKLLLGRMMRSAAPFIARGTSLFIVSDLISQIQRLHNGDKTAWVGIEADAACLTIDVAEVGIEIAESFELIEGISAITGPIGMVITTAIFIGVDIYYAVQAINKIDNITKLTGYEKFVNGFLAFLHLGPQQYIEHMVEEKQFNNLLVQKGKTMLQNLSKEESLKNYIMPGLEKYCFDCPVPSCIVIAPIYNCMPVKPEKTCTCHVKQIEDNVIDLRQQGIRYSRTWPDEITDDIGVICSNSVLDPKLLYPNNGFVNAINWIKKNVFRKEDSYKDIEKFSYSCTNALGIQSKTNNINSHTLIEIGIGNDSVVGFPNAMNIITISDGNKHVHGGNTDDIFILHGNKTTGLIYSYGGKNTLNFGSYAKEFEVIISFYNTTGATVTRRVTHKDYTSYDQLYISNISSFIGRKYIQDRLISSCSVEFINLAGGKSYNALDEILIPYSPNCPYKLQIDISSNTEVLNYANIGEFLYNLEEVKGFVKVHVENGTHVKHVFNFNHSIHDLKMITLEKVQGHFDLHCQIFTNNSFTEVIIKNHNKACVYPFKDKAEIMTDGESIIITQNTTLSTQDAILQYQSLANKLGVVIVAYSSTSNETILVGHGKMKDWMIGKDSNNQSSVHANILINDPSHHSHLVGGNTENMFIITGNKRKADFILDDGFVLPVTIHHYSESNFTNILDLSGLASQMIQFFNATIRFSIKEDTIDHDLIIMVFGKVENESQKLITRIILKDGKVNYNYQKLLVKLKQPLKIIQDKSFSLIPVPIIINESKSYVFITSDDVEPDTEIIIGRILGDYKFFKLLETLIITNVYLNTKESLPTFNQTSVVLHNFFNEPDLQTLKINFKDEVINFKEISMANLSADSSFIEEVEKFRSHVNETLFYAPF